jgi:hypothetical protein
VLIDISERTLKRWRGADGRVDEDQRPEELLSNLVYGHQAAFLSD